mgnify:CR=1 FL=1|jgi:ribosomal-protein-alanine N-acetyltransferase
MRYLIREMEIDDIMAVIAGEEEIFGTSLGYDMLYSDLVLNPLAHYLVLEIDDLVEGYIGLWIDENAEVINFFIRKAYQGMGFGKLLLDFATNLCKLSGVKMLSLEVRPSNLKAISLYTQFGFVKSYTRDCYYDDGEDAIVMIKNYEVENESIRS